MIRRTLTSNRLQKTVDQGTGETLPQTGRFIIRSHDHYQVPGACRRWIARSLNILNRMASIDEREVEKLFRRRQVNQLMGVSSHDFRDLRTEVTHVHELIRLVAKRHPDVKYKFSTVLRHFVTWYMAEN